MLNNGDQIVISGSENGTVFAWDLVEGNLIKKLVRRPTARINDS